MADFQSELDTFTHFATNGFTLPPLISNASDKEPPRANEEELSKGAKTGPDKAVESAVTGFFTGIFSSRVVAVLLGLILIAGSIYLFKPDAVNSAVAAVAA